MRVFTTPKSLLTKQWSIGIFSNGKNQLGIFTCVAGRGQLGKIPKREQCDFVKLAQELMYTKKYFKYIFYLIHYIQY